MKSKINFLCVCVLLLLSCEEKELANPLLGFDLADDSQFLYDVFETTYFIDDEPFTSISYVRDAVVDIHRTELETTYTIERYRRTSEANPWRIERVYKLKQTPAELIEIGESPEVRLTFPISENATFDKNRYNANGELKAFYLNVNKGFEGFPLTYSVYQANDSTLINLERIYDVYSPTDGLVYKEVTDLSYCQDSPDCIGTGEVSFGKQVIWRRVR